ncbi:hypothetical protein [Dehalogenimonas etheniformans]|uniref:hypothetical protein n=1 Tax=Dehalogenimonas etheniformans TaxID=1536648 RepID=UPI0013924943|nr:hypothetical protein [Dehalogenimonas etheniformans]QNT76266.1 hypothetical protein HX448_05965 [Dehalogenimonas etheniformans]
MDFEYHKGSLCIHRFQICQEGYCAECIIHLNALKAVVEKPRLAVKNKLPVLVRAQA